jgi:beta-1,4-mannosyl-glycoprotein beta-1,4-N-acetylglucosaminyltransferase
LLVNPNKYKEVYNIMASEQNKTLLIIPSQTRYIEYTFKKLYENILEPNKNIDIGCFISDESSLQNIESEVKYIFTLPEYSDHRDGLINELNAINIKIPQILNNKQLLKRYQISTIIHIYYRLFILRMLKENNLIDKYDWFIINRSDLIHTKPIIVENLNIEKVYLPDGEHYGGLPDRFAIIPKKYIERWLFIYNERFFTDYNLIDYHIEKYGPETMTAYNAEKNNISIKYIPYSFYCICDKADPTDWRKEVYMPDIKLFVKYPNEYNFALQNKKDSIKNNTSIIDCFGFYNELDLLNYRLNLLYDIVDYFILVESTHTFVGNKKELYFNNNKTKYDKFLDKIIHIIVEDMPLQFYSKDTTLTWKNENHQRICISRGINQLTLKDNDIIIISDLDEIPNPELIINKDNILITEHSIPMDLYWYNLHRIRKNEWIRYAKILTYKNYLKYRDSHEIRATDLPIINSYKNGWHLSYFGDVDFIHNKLNNFAHQEKEVQSINNKDEIKKRLQNGEDLSTYNRDWKFDYISISQNENLPAKYDIFLEKYYCNGICQIKYNGRHGNKLFMYFIARLYAEKHNLNLINNIDNTFFEIKNRQKFGYYQNYNQKTYIIKDSDLIDNQLPYYGNGIYIFDGFFQNEDIFYENKEKILSYVNLNYNKKDIFTIHVRLDDYFYPNKRHLIISIDYYIYCIKKYANNYKNIYIICDKLRYDWEKKYMLELTNKIKLLNKIPIYIENSISNDFINIVQSNYIVTSNSTFCFWAVYFSNAEKIISFPYTGIDILPNNKINKWANNPKIFKYNDKKFITNTEYSNNVIDYFEAMFHSSKIHFITYGNDNFKKSKARVLKEAEEFGEFSTITGYGPEDLDDNFKEKYKDILKEKRGGGYWIWRPYILNKKFQEIDDDDIMIFLDAGCTINPKGKTRLYEYINMFNNTDKGIISFKYNSNFFKQSKWCTKEIFNYFNINVDSSFANLNQLCGGILIIKKNKHSQLFITKFLKILNDNPYLFTDKYNNNNQILEFIDNRHDQSISTIIRYQIGTILCDYDESNNSIEFVWTTRIKK